MFQQLTFRLPQAPQQMIMMMMYDYDLPQAPQQMMMMVMMMYDCDLPLSPQIMMTDPPPLDVPPQALSMCHDNSQYESDEHHPTHISNETQHSKHHAIPHHSLHSKNDVPRPKRKDQIDVTPHESNRS